VSPPEAAEERIDGNLRIIRIIEAELERRGVEFTTYLPHEQPGGDR
jgi:hypothetical protein